MIPQELRTRQFALDGEPTSIVEFVYCNVESGHFDAGDIEDIRVLDVGESITYGGGASASFTLKRVA